MGVTTTPINGFTLPDDNEALRNVYSHLRNHAAQLEAALRSHGLTSADVTGYLDLVGQVNTLSADQAADKAAQPSRAVWVPATYSGSTWTLPAAFTVVPGMTTTVVVPANKRLEIAATFPEVAVAVNTSAFLEVRAGTTVLGSAVWATAAAPVFMPAHIIGKLDPTSSDRTVTLAVYGQANTATTLTTPASGMVPQLRYQLV